MNSGEEGKELEAISVHLPSAPPVPPPEGKGSIVRRLDVDVEDLRNPPPPYNPQWSQEGRFNRHNVGELAKVVGNYIPSSSRRIHDAMQAWVLFPGMIALSQWLVSISKDMRTAANTAETVLATLLNEIPEIEAKLNGTSFDTMSPEEAASYFYKLQHKTPGKLVENNPNLDSFQKLITVLQWYYIGAALIRCFMLFRDAPHEFHRMMIANKVYSKEDAESFDNDPRVMAYYLLEVVNIIVSAIGGINLLNPEKFWLGTGLFIGSQAVISTFATYLLKRAAEDFRRDLKEPVADKERRDKEVGVYRPRMYIMGMLLAIGGALTSMTMSNDLQKEAAKKDGPINLHFTQGFVADAFLATSLSTFAIVLMAMADREHARVVESSELFRDGRVDVTTLTIPFLGTFEVRAGTMKAARKLALMLSVVATAMLLSEVGIDSPEAVVVLIGFASIAYGLANWQCTQDNNIMKRLEDTSLRGAAITPLPGVQEGCLLSQGKRFLNWVTCSRPEEAEQQAQIQPPAQAPLVQMHNKKR